MEGNELVARRPGDVLFFEYMKPAGLTSTKLGLELRVTQQRVNKILCGESRIMPEMALRLAAYFDSTTAGDWMALQTDYDLCLAEAEWAEEIARQVRPIGGAMKPSGDVVWDASIERVKNAGRERKKRDAPRVEVELSSEPTAAEREKLDGLEDLERRVFDLILAGEHNPDRMIIDAPIGNLLASLTMLELADLVFRDVMGNYFRGAAKPHTTRRRRWR